MGMRLMEGMTRGLNGRLTIEGDQGTRFEVQFPLVQPMHGS